MATPALQDVFDAARGYLSDTQVAGGEVFTNTVLQVSFNEPYRTLFNCLAGSSKRVEKVIVLKLPAYNTVLIPSAYGISDFSEPELIEERPMPASAIAVASTDTSTPINVTTTAPHGLSTNTAGNVSQVRGTAAPWGNWFITVTGSSTFSLNGSVSDGTAGTGGQFIQAGTTGWSEVYPLDEDGQGLDGQPQQYLGCYVWNDERLRFRGAVNDQELRITYWASGAPPTASGQSLGIDNCLDFLACATAANAARSKGWFQLADQLKFSAYGADQQAKGDDGLLGSFLKIQVVTLQRGPQRRRRPFRSKNSRFGNYVTSG